MSGQLATFAGLRALRHLDLQLVRVDQVFGGDAEARRRDLLDARAQRVAFPDRNVDDDALDARAERLALAYRQVAARVLTAFAGIRLAADPIHRDRERRVRLGRDRAQTHRTGREALDDLRCRLDLVQRYRRAGPFEFEQAAQRHQAAALIVDQLCVFLVGRMAVASRRMLQLGDRVGRPHVLLAADAVLIFSSRIERVAQHRTVAERGLVQPIGLVGDFEQPDALDVARGAGEILVDERAVQSDRLEDLRAAIGLIGRDAHLGHHLVQALADRLDEALGRLLGGDFRHDLVQLGERFQREIRVDCLGAVPGEQREMMHLARRSGFDDEASAGAQPLAHKVLVHGGGREQRRDRHQLGRDVAVGHDQDVEAEVDGVLGMRTQARECRFHSGRTPCRGIADVELARTERRAGEQADVTDLFHLVGGQDRLPRLQAHRQIDGVGRDIDREQVGPRSDERHQRHHQLFADRIDRRIGHLREQLFEIAVEHLRPVRQYRQGGVVAHRADRLLAVQRHRRQDHLQVFLRVAERLLPVEQGDFRALRRRRRRKVLERDARPVDPRAVRLGRRQRTLQLGVIDDPTLVGVDEQHLSGLQPPFPDHLALGNVEHADLGGHDHVVVVGDDVARRAKAVAIERRTDLATVGERHRCRAVPWLHQRGVVFVECAPVLVHKRIAGPRFRDHQHHRVGERIPAHQQELEAVVERRGIGLPVVNQRPDLVEVVAEHRAGDRLLSRADPVHVAAQRVDLAVVADQTERMREIPRREGVGRKALVHHRQCRHHRRVAQIQVVLADLMGEQHSLVDDRSRRHRRHVELLAVP